MAKIAKMYKLCWYYQGKHQKDLIYSAPYGVCAGKRKKLEKVKHNGYYKILAVG